MHVPSTAGQQPSFADLDAAPVTAERPSTPTVDRSRDAADRAGLAALEAALAQAVLPQTTVRRS
jgi:hypothetical protein